MLRPSSPSSSSKAKAAATSRSRSRRAGCARAIPMELTPGNARVKSYVVVERHSWIWVWMGEAAEADPALIPPAVGLDHPDYILGHGHLDYAAEARLINDNLLDFSHLSYVHANSFGA